MDKETALRKCITLLSEIGLITSRYSMYKYGIGFNTKYDSKEDIHGHIFFDTNSIEIATSAGYRDINNNEEFIRRLQEVNDICKKCQKIMREVN